MNPRVITVEATNNHFLKLSFDNDEIKLFDASPFLDKGIFKELQDYNLSDGSSGPFRMSYRYSNITCY